MTGAAVAGVSAWAGFTDAVQRASAKEVKETVRIARSDSTEAGALGFARTGATTSVWGADPARSPP